MAASNFVRFGFAACASAALTFAGCVSSPSGMTADYSLQGTQVPQAETANTVWDQLKTWRDAMASGQTDQPKLKNPGKLHLAYARWQEQLGNLVEARESYELALGDDPRSVDAVLGLARLDQLNGRPHLAEQRYLRALRLKPNDANVLDATGQFYAQQGKWDRSIDLLQQSVIASPNESTHRYNLAVALARSGRFDEALPHFSRTVGEAEAHYNVGYILYEQGDLARAEREFLQAVLKRPKLGEAQQMLEEVRAHRAQGQMLAGGQPANRQDPTQAVSNISTGQTHSPNANHVSRGPAADERYDEATRYQTATNSAAVSGLRRGASAQQPSQQTYRSGSTWRDPAATGGRPGVTGSPAQANLPPWHTSPEFQSDTNTSRYGTTRNASQQVDSSISPQTSPPTGTRPSRFDAGSPAPDSRGPTQEQLEQWRNQFTQEDSRAGYFTPANRGTGY